MKRITIILFLMASSAALASPLQGSAEAHIFYNKEGHIGVLTHVYCEHKGFLKNNTDIVQSVKAIYQICINNECKKSNATIRLNPHATWSDGIRLDVEGYLLDRTIYAVTGSTRYIQEYNNFHLTKIENGVINVTG